MKIIEQSFEVLDFPENALERIEQSARVCYQSEPKGNNEQFVKRLIEREHMTPLEHCSPTVKIITDRGVMAELTRHRLASFNIESTRYCNYSKKDIEFVSPCFWQEDSEQYKVWLRHIELAEKAYNILLLSGATPEEARSILPMSLKTEIIITANFREWLHIFNLRCSEKSHPSMREIMCKIKEEFKRRCSVVFE